MIMIPHSYKDILAIIDSIDPILYGKTRNYIDGAVTKLSPYLSRGVISTKLVAERVLSKGYSPQEIQIFLKELAWRDYYQQVWKALGTDINNDIKQPQQNVTHRQIPSAIIKADTGITTLDEAIIRLYQDGYMHNHLRMYVASVCCNIGQSHWLLPAKWMYYHLLDADWASNALSWQWIVGSFSNKKYYANQENINLFCHGHQKNTFLDTSYENIALLSIPDSLKPFSDFECITKLPNDVQPNIDETLPSLVYNFYNLDPEWQREQTANRILLLEPDLFEAYPISESSVHFMLQIAQLIDRVQLFVGSFDELCKLTGNSKIHYKEHPLNKHYKGIEHPRAWMFESVNGFFPSFFSYWKQCERLMHHLRPLS